MKRPVALVAVVALALVLLHVLGARESTHVLAGIVAAPHEPVLALLYLACWFFTVLVSPIVLIAHALRAFLSHPRGCYAVADADRVAHRNGSGDSV